MWEKYNRFVQMAGGQLAFWLQVGSLFSIAAISGLLARFSKWMKPYGDLGWWFAFLIGLATALMLLGLIFWIRRQYVLGGAIRKWSEATDDINPLDSSFSNKRIRLSDLAHPITRTVENKSFHNCELIGPANIYLDGNGVFSGISFLSCDVVVVKDQSVLFNVIRFKDIKMLGGQIASCVLFIPAVAVPELAKMGACFATLTGIKELDEKPFPAFKPF